MEKPTDEERSMVVRMLYAYYGDAYYLAGEDSLDKAASELSLLIKESAEQARKEERITTLEEVRSICLIETSITTDDIDRLIEQAKSQEAKR